jgi:acetyl esterase/lipase
MVSETRPTLHAPARDIPVPLSVSPQAQAMLAMGPLFETEPYPALDDLEGWRRRVAQRDASMLTMIGDRASSVEADVQDLDVDGVRVYVITPPDIAEADPRVYVEVHGGALIQGGGECCRIMGLNAMLRSRVRTWAIDYRMPPDHPYPAPLDDCLAVYRAILRDHRPEEVIVGGGSAGGNLTAAMILRARDEGLPLPAAAVLLTPEVDLTESGDSFQTNLGLDNVLTESLMPANLLYAAGHDLTDPYLSPLFGDFTKGFPPTILASGTRDLFLSNTVRMHRALRCAGVPADLHIVEAGGHGGFFGQAPEDEDLAQEVRLFIDAHWPRR